MGRGEALAPASIRLTGRVRRVYEHGVSRRRSRKKMMQPRQSARFGLARFLFDERADLEGFHVLAVMARSSIRLIDRLG